MNEKSVTIHELVSLGHECRRRTYTDNEIRELFDDDVGTLVIALLNRAQAAEQAIEERDAVLLRLIDAYEAQAAMPDAGVDELIARARKLLQENRHA